MGRIDPGGLERSNAGEMVINEISALQVTSDHTIPDSTKKLEKPSRRELGWSRGT